MKRARANNLCKEQPLATALQRCLPAAVRPAVSLALALAVVCASAAAHAEGLPRNYNFADASSWIRIVGGSGVRLTPMHNGFEVDYADQAQPGANEPTPDTMYAGYISTFAVHGDFTLDIDYCLKTWPAENGIRLGVGIWPYVGMLRAGTTEGGEIYSFTAGPAFTVPTSDRQGTLRLVRSGGTLLGYYRSSAGGAWVLAGSRSGDPVFSEDLQVGLSSWAHGSSFGTQPAAITMGNFVMTAEAVLPGPYGLPYWVAPQSAPAAPQETSVPPLASHRPGMFTQRSQRFPAPPMVWQPESPGLPTRNVPFPDVGPRGIQPLEAPGLPAGILEEDLNLDLNAAIQSYQSLVNQFDAQRPMAANAIFRMAECYRRLGRMDEARSHYARILREFADQAPLVRLSRKYAADVTATPTGPLPEAGALAGPRLTDFPANDRGGGKGRGLNHIVAHGDTLSAIIAACRERHIMATLDQILNANPGLDPNSLRVGRELFIPIPESPRSSGLVSWWAGEGNANDSTGANPGVAEGAVAFVPGEVGQAFSFNGVDADVKVRASSSLDVGLGAGLTVEAWIRPADVSHALPIVEWNSGAGAVPYGVHFWTSEPAPFGAGPGCLYANLVDAAGGDHALSSVGSLLTTSDFQHVALTYDKTSGVARIYLNGAVVAQEDLGTLTPQTSSDLYLGYRPAGAPAGTRYVGQMGEVGLYNRALSLAEVRASYAARQAGKSVVPVASANETTTLERQLAQARTDLLKARNELARLLDSVESGVIDRNELLKARSEVAGLRTEPQMNPTKAQEQREHGKVYVTGQVVHTGPLEIPEGAVFTVSKAILTAGGFTDFADKRHVRLIRGGRQGQGSTNNQSMLINVAEILEKGGTANDPPVQADDVIYVPKRNVSF